MKIVFKILFYVSITTLVLLTVFYAGKWFLTDSSGESGFAIITGCIIPIVLLLNNWISRKFGVKSNDALAVTITKKYIRCYKRDVDYAIHIEVELFASTKVSIKDITLLLDEPIGWSRKSRNISHLPKILGRKNDLLNLESKMLISFIDECERLQDLPLVINESEHLIFTIAGFIEGERLPDGWEGLKLSGWRLVFEYNDGDLKTEGITLDVHKKSLTEPSEYRVVGFCDV